MVETIKVPDGYLADVITHLEMTERPSIEIPASPLVIEPWPNPDPDAYIDLFRHVGDPWLWQSRLLLTKEELAATLSREKLEFFRIVQDREPVGFLELDFGVKSQCEIGFLGLIPSLNGQGHGRWLMAETFKRAWRDGIERVWLHTCTLDSPFALKYYQKCGFTAFKREMSMGPDPRLSGLLPKSAGPHVPMIS